MPDVAGVQVPEPSLIPVVRSTEPFVGVVAADPPRVVLTSGPNVVWSIVGGN